MLAHICSHLSILYNFYIVFKIQIKIMHNLNLHVGYFQYITSTYA